MKKVTITDLTPEGGDVEPIDLVPGSRVIVHVTEAQPDAADALREFRFVADEGAKFTAKTA